MTADCPNEFGNSFPTYSLVIGPPTTAKRCHRTLQSRSPLFITRLPLFGNELFNRHRLSLSLMLGGTRRGSC